ncbi:hypothetical protein ACFLSE_06660 [Bacteroidota bacterium]
MNISTLLLQKENPCGISLFNEKLIDMFRRLGFNPKEYDFKKSNSFNDNCTLFHYVPSLYADYNDVFDKKLKVCNNLITIIHGIYPKGKFNYLGDTVNNFQKTQLEIIRKYSKSLIFLSYSTLNIYKDWFIVHDEKKKIVLRHPGLNKKELKMELNQNKYVFTGGIIRKKKSYESQKEKKLLQSLDNKGIKVWLHSTNNTTSTEVKNMVWKYTFGSLQTSQWNKIIYQSKIILCPYSTEIQTVSGILSEGISCGKLIISTSFPYALEISQEYNEYIIIENDINKWSNIISENWDKNKTIPKFNDWYSFGKNVIRIINNVC